MRWTRRRVQAITTWAVVVGWAVFSAVALAHADPLPTPDTAVMWLVVPPLLWVVAVRLVLRHWWSETGPPMSAMDLPGRLLAAAVGGAPRAPARVGSGDDRRAGRGPGSVARWRFALSSARAALRLPPAGGWPVLALMLAVVAVATAGPAVGAAVPGLTVFAVSFTGLLGAMVVLAVARSRRPRLPAPAPAPTVLVTGGVAAAIAIAVTVIFLRRQPAAAGYLPPAAAVCLAAVLAGCLWIALASPRWLGTSQLAPHLGAAAAVVFAAWFLLANRTDGTQPPFLLVLGLAAVLVVTPIAVFFVTRSTAGCCSTARWSPPSAPTWLMPWSSASASFPCSASPSG
jgi:hypothetical protein